MARARNIKPGFFTNDVLGELPPLARLLFAGLWTLCDREGRVEDRPKKIKAELLPYDDCDGDELLTMLEASGFIARYFKDGKRVIQVLEFAKHQNPHVKEAPSSLPALDESGASTVQAPGKAQPEPERAGLIPDSPTLIPDSPTPEPSPAGRVCLAMRQTGMLDVNPGHPTLLALIAAGCTDAEFRGAAELAVSKAKGFAYAIGMLKRQREEAAALELHQGAMPSSKPPVTVADNPQVEATRQALAADREREKRLSDPEEQARIAAAMAKARERITRVA